MSQRGRQATLGAQGKIRKQYACNNTEYTHCNYTKPRITKISDTVVVS
jgi:hypothetical protein